MAAPPEIIDSLQSILEIFFSGVRHRERAAFILCDNLVEMACKTKAKQHNHNFNMSCGFFDAWNAPGVQLAPNGLGQRVQGYRNTRNNMQHASAATTVDAQHCATAILDAVRVIDHCWAGTSKRDFSNSLTTTVRLVRFYSSEGLINSRGAFEDKMRSLRWRGTEKESVRASAIQIEPGIRDYWWLVLRTHPQLIDECLNDLGAP